MLYLYAAAGYRLLEAVSLNDVGYGHALVGNYQQAIDCCERALAVAQELDEPGWESATWHSLGFIHQRLGDHQSAIACYERSLELTRRLCDRFNEVDTLNTLGDTYESAGDVAGAHRIWDRALRIFQEIQHPDAELIRAKLNGERVFERAC